MNFCLRKRERGTGTTQIEVWTAVLEKGMVCVTLDFVGDSIDSICTGRATLHAKEMATLSFLDVISNQKLIWKKERGKTSQKALGNSTKNGNR